MFAADSKGRRFADSVLFSYAQLLFSNRRWFGAVLLAATFFHPPSGMLALAGVCLSNAVAYLLKYDPARIRSGFYGFNGILLGAAYGYYLNLTPFLLAIFPIFILISFVVAAALENYLATAFNLPGLSLPFVLTLFIVTIFLWNYDAAIFRTSPLEQFAGAGALPAQVRVYFHSLSLILFQSHLLAGMLVALGLLLFSRVMFVLSVVGFAACALFVQLLLPEHTESFAVLAGLNAILTAIALGGALIIPSRKSLALAVLAVLMVVVFTGVFVRITNPVHLPVMVLSFNLVVLGTLYSLKFRSHSSGLVLLYFLPGSPEENYYYHSTVRARFHALKYFLPDLPFSGAWTVSQGYDGPHTHRGDWKHALDFVVCGEDGKTYQNGGHKPEDYHCYRLPVLAAEAGEVVAVVDGIPNNRIGEVNLQRNWGNTIVLKHMEGLFSAVSHLEPGSLRVCIGQWVPRGETLALCGSSGRSPEPHLHFQFQATGKVGEKTLPYPLGSILEEKDGQCRLKVSEPPAEMAVVQNLMTQRNLKVAFTFPLDSVHRFLCRFGAAGEPFEETWEVKVDVYNVPYFESSAGAWLNFFANEKMFYLTDFRGNRRSALYHFYLCAMQMPLGYYPRLTWTDVLPLSKVLHSAVKPISELLLLAGPQIRAEVEFHFEEPQAGNGGTPGIVSELQVRGKGVFAAYRKASRGRLHLSASGAVSGFEYSEGERPVFSAERVAESSPAAVTASVDALSSLKA
ncbi:MAG TPA: urea transporter [bacterium]|jgi:urea transporter/murein DD-endopeptidase MepM/ murein hydrolase activator NlpD